LLFNGTGPLLYLCFGNGSNLPRKKHKKIIGYLQNEVEHKNILKEVEVFDNLSYRISTFLHNTTGLYPSPNQGEEFYGDGQELFDAMIESIDEAKRYIFLEYFIVASGKMLDELIVHLQAAANRGVEIKFLYDYVGCNVPKVLHKDDLEILKSISNCEVVAYNPPGITLNLGINYRDHRKILLIDGDRCFVGGINIADEYIHKKDRFGFWRDNGMKIMGEACYNYLILFAKNWYMSTNEKLEIEAYKSKEVFTDLGGYIFPFGDGPHNKLNPAYDIYLKLIENAKECIYISTPYLIIDNVFLKAIANQAKAGVEVILLVPEIADKKLVYLMTENNFTEILNAGGKIYKFKGGFNHAKTMVIDDDYAIVGTVNIDYRSMFLHFECCNLLMKTESVKEIKKDFLQTLTNSLEVDLEVNKKRNPFKRLLSFFLSIFGPLF
jgi:cardiolipin synthase